MELRGIADFRLPIADWCLIERSTLLRGNITLAVFQIANQQSEIGISDAPHTLNHRR
jgi:hypothetical protein